MDLQNSHFAFTAILKQEQDISFEGLQVFPGLSEISFRSRIFSSYAECVKSCKSLLDDVSADVNRHEPNPKYKVGAEVNPIHTGTQTLSKDWGETEVARFWVYDKNMEGNNSKIAAICKGSVMVVPKQENVQYLNWRNLIFEFFCNRNWYNTLSLQL